jgi:hypothetical protein
MANIAKMDLSWHHFLTPQEHHMIGSSPGVCRKNGKSYSECFYTPIIIQEEGLKIELVSQLREIYNELPTPHYFWRDNEGRLPDGGVLVRLPPLDPQTGETIHDPKPLDSALKLYDEFGEIKVRADSTL